MRFDLVNAYDWLCAAHGIFYIVTGAWPFIHLHSFLAVTGPKNDIWLVKTVGALIVVIGLALLLAGAFEGVTWSVFLLAVSASIALASVDIVYVAKRVIGPVYLLDAAVEVILIVGWLLCISLKIPMGAR